MASPVPPPAAGPATSRARTSGSQLRTPKDAGRIDIQGRAFWSRPGAVPFPVAAPQPRPNAMGFLLPKPGRSASRIEKARSDDDLLNLLFSELTRLAIRARRTTIEEQLAFLRSLPIGLRAMAAVYELDVSLALDDLGWHFGNWPSIALAEETWKGLKELGAHAEAAIFKQAFTIAKEHWAFIRSSSFENEYLDSELDQRLKPLNEALWSMMSPDHPNSRTLLSYWAPYARLHPDRVVGTIARPGG